MPGVCDPYDPDYDQILCDQQNAAPPADPTTTGATGTGTPGSLDPSGGYPTFTAPKDKSLSVPQNILTMIQEAATAQGMPDIVLAAVIHQRIGTRWTSLTPDIIAAVAAQISSAYDKRVAEVSRDESMRSVNYGKSEFTALNRSLWADAAADYGTQTRAGQSWVDYHGLFDSLTARAPTVGADVNIPAGNRQLASFPGGVGGGTSGRSAATGSSPSLFPDSPYTSPWDSVFFQYMGRYPNAAEQADLAAKKWTLNQLTDYLRARPYGDTGQTIGQYDDIKQAMETQFLKILGRAPTDAEIHYALTAGIPANNADALAEQIRDHTVWAVDPTLYRATRQRIETALAKYGIQLTDAQVSNDLVNQAAQGNWTDQQIAETVGKGQHPGSPPGTTNDQYKAVRDNAQSVWGIYFPSKPLSETDLQKMLTMTPDQISAYIRSMPSDEALAAGKVIPVGTYHDMKDAAQAALDRLGFPGEQVTPADIALFASQKMSLEDIATHYKNDPALVAKNPGLPYDLTKEQYQQNLSEIQGSAQTHGGALDDAAIKEAFKEKMAPAEVQAGITDEFKRLGKTPTAADVAGFRTRPKDPLEADMGGVATKKTPLGPTSDLADPNAQSSPFSRR
jgi:hypothetical protein